jgi:PadR family transcriptional regulator, regulatory protein PadR
MNLLQGTLDLLVLKALVLGPRHGYEVARWVRDTTQGALQVDDGALYTALHRLEKRGLIEAEWGVADTGRRAKFYSLTRAGKSEMAREARAWTSYVEAVFKILQAAEA